MTDSTTIAGSELFADQFAGPARQTRTIGDKQYLRVHKQCPVDGNSYFDITSLDSGGNEQQRDRPMPFHSGWTAVERFRLRSNPVQRFGTIRPPVDADFQDELSRLREARFPTIAKMLEREAAVERITELPPGALFTLGDSIQVTHAVTESMCMDYDELDGYLAKFQAGDFGTLGRLADVQPSEDKAWAPCLFGPATENWAAICTQSGLIRSEYLVGRPGDRPYQYGGGATTSSNVPRRRESDTLAIWTLLCPGRPPKTLCFSPTRNTNV